MTKYITLSVDETEGLKEDIEVIINRNAPFDNFEIKEICAKQIIDKILSLGLVSAERKSDWETRMILPSKEQTSGRKSCLWMGAAIQLLGQMMEKFPSKKVLVKIFLQERR